MLNNKCPIGYYCDARASQLEDFFLCEPGYYCPSGSSKSKFKQNECLVGYYCPRGTAGDITANGTFNNVYQIKKYELVSLIDILIKRNEKAMREFELSNKKTELEDFKATLKRL